MSTVVTLQGVSFELANGRRLFSDLHFSLEPKITALIGPNGVGKTCLARILAGELEPTTGSVRRNSAITYFSQRLPVPEMSVDQFLNFDYQWSETRAHLLEGIARESNCRHLSGGQWMRLRLARALGEGFLILDEPTNDLDPDGREAVFRFLRSHRGGVLLISHDRECLQLCDEVLELSNQGLAKFGGSWDEYEKARDLERSSSAQDLVNAERAHDEILHENQTKKERQEKRNRRGTETAARGGAPKILLGTKKRRAQVHTGKLAAERLAFAEDSVQAAKEAFLKQKIDPQMYADLMGSAIAGQKLVAEAQGFNIRFQDWLYPQDLSFSWRGNIRLALKGGNGSGKSTLLKAILGEKFENKGDLRFGHLSTLYVDQRCAGLDDQKSIFENIRDVSALDESEIRNGLAKFLFTKDSVFQKVESLSGGERLRAALAQGLLATEKPELLILDEPTNNLDLENIRFLENLLKQFPAALIVISHDPVFLENSGITDEFKVR